MQQNAKLKIGVALALFVVAGGVFAYTSTRSDEPEYSERSSSWYCIDCKVEFKLNDDAPPGTMIAAEPKSAGDRPVASRTGQKKTILAKCPTCGQHSGRAGMTCGGCGDAFRLANDDGVTLICPKCKWDPLTGMEAKGDRVYILEDE